jgi:hypothetical protein
VHPAEVQGVSTKTQKPRSSQKHLSTGIFGVLLSKKLAWGRKLQECLVDSKLAWLDVCGSNKQPLTAHVMSNTTSISILDASIDPGT